MWPNQPKPFFHLLQLRDDHGELGRCTLHDSGLWGRCGLLQEGVESNSGRRLSPLSGLEGTLQRRFGLSWKVSAAQFVTTDGTPFCSPISPCISFKRGERSYLLMREKVLWELELDRPVSVTEFRRRQVAAGLPRLGHIDPDVVELSIGFGWARANRVAGTVEDLP